MKIKKFIPYAYVKCKLSNELEFRPEILFPLCAQFEFPAQNKVFDICLSELSAPLLE